MNIMRIDESSKSYRVRVHCANISHWLPNIHPIYDFHSIEEVCDFLEDTFKVGTAYIRERDSKQDHGSLAATSWYDVIKGYRDTPECYLF